MKKCEHLWQQFDNVKRCLHDRNTQPTMKLDGETPGFCTEDKCPLKKGKPKIDEIHSVETVCPNCSFKVIHFFQSGRYLIGKFVEDLMNLDTFTIRNNTLELKHTDLINLIKKWEELQYSE